MRPIHHRWLEPVLQKKRYRSGRLERVQAQLRRQIGLLIDRIFDQIAAQDGRFSLATTRATQSLTEAGNRRRCANLSHALYRADIDAQLQCVGADGGGGSFLLLQSRFGLIADFLGQAAMVRPELIGNLLLLAHGVE